LRAPAGFEYYEHRSARLPDDAARRGNQEQFSAADLIISARVFITSNPQVKKQDQTEGLLEVDDHYLELDSTFDVGHIDDVVHPPQKITTDVHKGIMAVYADSPTHKYILSSGVCDSIRAAGVHASI
jgi:hypothetical protein